MAFSELGLDPRLLRGLEKRGFTQATAVQLETIPHALEGRDVVARARTGSGKTLAYVLPALHKLAALPPDRQRAPWQALILVPTRELCEQVKAEAEALVQAAGLEVVVTALTATGAGQRDQFLHAGQVVVATPGRIAQALKEGRLRPQALQPHEGLRRPGLCTLVLDEADLILSMPGYEADLQQLAPKVPRGCQCLLMSATTNASVERLQKLVLHSPVALDLLHAAGPAAAAGGGGSGGQDASGSAAEIEHFRIRCSKADRLLHTLALLKLGLVRRKVLLFVNTVPSGVRLRLFLESFGIRAALIHAELPLNSRHHILQEFNRSIFDYLIAVDNAKKTAAIAAAAADAGGGGGEGRHGRKRKRGERDSDAEFGVTRGVDFKGVETVLNVEPPLTPDGYVHRVGRTGRAGRAGTAVSLLGPQDAALEAQLQAQLGGAPAERQQQASGELEAAGASEAAAGPDGQPARGGLAEFARLAPGAVEALRYRAEDVARSLSGRVVSEARARELRAELLNSQRLEAYFQEHPGDHVLLKHDKPLAKKPEAPHLKHLPPYLRAAGACGTGGSSGVLSAKKRRKLKRGTDPIKGGFLPAPRKGGGGGDELTEAEKQAEAYGKKVARKQAKQAAKLVYKPKQNVRKKR